MTQASTAHPTGQAEPEHVALTDRDAPPGVSGGGVPGIVRRRLATVDAHLDGRSWLATGVIVAIAAILRFLNLSHPPGKVFDEVYYARDAWGLVDRGVEWNYQDGAPSYVVHPPLGKWLIGLGEWAFGYSDTEHGVSVAGHLVTTAPEFGWRFSAAVAGTLSVLLLVRIGRRMFRSTALGCAAGLLLALDGFHLVLSRTALLDIFLLFFVLATFGALLLDRDSRRRRWARAMEAGLEPRRPGRAGRPAGGWRNWPWWRLTAGVLFGCACAVKWSALYFLPVFALLVVLWEVGARRSAGVRRPWRDTMLDEVPWLVAAGLLMAVTYVATWSGWLLGDEGYYRLAERYPNAPLSDTPVIGALNNLVEYHKAAYGFHAQLDDPHKYQSWPWQWLLLGRPVAFYWSGDGPCGAASCASEVLLLGTPLLWWSFLPALAALAWLGLARRDWRAGAILLCVAGGLLPWFWFAVDGGRTMFSFYTAPALPFLVLAVTYVLGTIVGPPEPAVGGAAVREASYDRRLVGAVVAGAYVLLVALCFAYFYPIFVGETIPYGDWSNRMWLDGRWI
ncbi:phospholipid carrier-dependent glycosyltransferase [Micromonospora sp. WMMA1363]|uniref:dolichyl-phosphate-mannose--protein mannosyltransferase n=1 Tax=Micromonospora sp. WMMA1363 TaxID=3053985 RepID=UPI00259CA195|nr:phospholipid carrier-dependent glycosyltransferase [Micromonospora sp. WMMA1363]MDM4722396.1 phospholipid carrier-dependent glycosyltransferase [Micromonospora sp. WMMA1363]